MAASRSGYPTPPTPDDPDHSCCPICGWCPCTSTCRLGLTKADISRCALIAAGGDDAFDPFEGLEESQ